ncbi:MAG TPA: LpqB family beta-propeller domain-containing protein [Propioniciclava sp.]|jgi:hypothetical protein|uniref:LpqB family beta-propeller domain-containing protein n=1 Tax=Propioniciclava sp. TaxID=2038686 RepID=UPI002C645FB9|nr:LpqB family beta-propeller domain-containing protein [Propioniciclava sp.]HRL50076.1 LpqB family beta-propeller domain-containing protein [Propioniciclava sp.]HRL80060.1 LpqB family beta-propeller domain-containing protein [Propioniciclava sp.]
MAKVVSVLMLAVCLLLSGCSGVPTSGPVERVSADPGHFNSGVEIAPAPPGPNASPVEVVEGFLHAQASWQPQYEVARAYLTAEASQRWRPEAGVRVYAEGNPVVATDTSATLRAPLVGTVDAAGAYRQSTGSLDQDFGLVKDAAGHWRISNPPEGLTISEYLFASAFSRVIPYFFEPGGRWLVPDPRYFPRGSQAYDGAVRALLEGPTDWLEPAVQATTVRASLAGVTVSSAGVAAITLRGTGPEPDAAARIALLTQLTRTFGQFETVTAVEVMWEGAAEAWTVAPYGRTIPVGAFPDSDPAPRQGSRQLFAVTDGVLVRAMEGGGGNANLVVAPGITTAVTAAVRSDAVSAAAVTQDRTAVVVGPLSENSSQTVLTGVGLRRPDFDRQGLLWVNDDQGDWWLQDATGAWRQLDTSAFGEGTIETFRIAPDGIRVAIIVQRPSGEHVLGVARIDRTDDVAVRSWRELSVATTSVASTSVIDVGWRTADSLLALVGEGRTTQVFAIAQDGASIAAIGPTAVADPEELAVAPGVPAMVRTTGGDVWRYNSDFRWSLHLTGASSVLYPG